MTTSNPWKRVQRGYRPSELVLFCYGKNVGKSRYANALIKAHREIPMKRQLRSKFTVNHVTADAVYITDDCEQYQCMSVTNDAEQVVEYLYEQFGDKQIFYKDTEGYWDELVHKNGVFENFRPGVKLNKNV